MTTASRSTSIPAKPIGSRGRRQNGLDHAGAGTTVMMLAHLKRIAPNRLQPGDLIVFDGTPAQQHVCVVVEPGADPVVTSLGKEEGPFKLSLSDEATGHTGQPVVHLTLM